MRDPHPRRYRLGDAIVDVDRNTISLGDQETRVEPRLILVMNLLVSRQGMTVRRSELLDAGWQGQDVADEALTKAVSLLRRALGDQDRSRRLIETIPKVGYRLAAHPQAVGPKDRPEPTKRRRWRPRRALGLGLVGAAVVFGLAYAIPGSVPASAEISFRNGQTPSQVAESDASSTAVNVPDDVLRQAKAVKIRKLTCPNSDPCSEGDGTMETVTIVNPGDDPALTRSLIEDALK